MDNEAIPSPSKQRLYIVWSIIATALLFSGIVGIANLTQADPNKVFDDALAAQREETLKEHQSKARRDAELIEWVNQEDKIARIPLDLAVDRVLQKYDDSGNITFAGDAAPTVGTKLSTGPFTLVEIPPLARDPARDTELMEMSQDPAIVEEGYYHYEAFCLQCHGGPDMPGEGPTVLFDGEWYYAANPSQMEQLLWKGILEKGMPPWEGVLPPEVTGAMIAYLLANQSQ